MNNEELNARISALSAIVQAIAQQLDKLSREAAPERREQVEEAFFRAESLQAYLDFVSNAP